ncbi:MAG: hypothetical protein J7K98_03315 [Candidatus Aenigmarchaeota archaeon]|nr:hypothetical protein [Candidatus Aenigmarchaeota archaeon]
MRKGQAAMEYLMTYGWAILIIIVVIAALYAMGVFKVGKPTVACSPCFSNFAFVDYSTAGGSGTLVIRNGPEQRNITSLSVGSMATDSECQLNQICDAGKTIKITGIPTTGDQTITITYISIDSGLTHTDTATIHNP